MTAELERRLRAYRTDLDAAVAGDREHSRTPVADARRRR